MRLHSALLAGAAGLMAACGIPNAPSSQVSVKGLQVVPGNPTCADLGYAEELKIESGALMPGSWISSSDGELVVQVFTLDSRHFDWSTNVGIDAVIVKGGDAANVYTYDPEARSGAGLVTPDVASSAPADISHIAFCYDYEVRVVKTASTFYHRDFAWQIQKEAVGDSELLLSPGQTFLMSYRVSVTSSHTDRDWATWGSITVHNPSTKHSALVASVTDTLAGVGSIAVDCGDVTFPYTLAPGADLVCAYSSPLPDGQDRWNTALVEVAPGSLVGGGSGMAGVWFGEPSWVTDACVAVDDDRAGWLGLACGDQVFEYVLPIGPYGTCGEHLFDNTATYTALDSQAQGSDSVSIPVEVACQGEGCTLTPGYWRTHSEFGPAPYDDTWAQVRHGASTIFFLSGASCYDVLWTPPQGNAYYILARAFSAAWLNERNGADASEVSDELAEAMGIFETYTPAQIGALRSKDGLRHTILGLAAVLDDFNNGVIGPGHCSE